MRRKVVAIAIAIAGVSSVFAACKSNEVNQSTSTTNNYMSVGPAGATVPGPDGTLLQVPPNALDKTIQMGIAVADEDEYPPFGEVQPVGKVYSFVPHGESFLIDATITMPAPNGDVDIYRAQPGGTWELFAKPKGVGTMTKFRTSGLSFYAVATGTGGCVRNLDCGAGQACVDKVCVAAPSDGGVETGTPETGSPETSFCATPLASTKTSTVSSDAPGSWQSGVATTKSENDGGTFHQDIRIKITDFTDSCAYATEDKVKAGAELIMVDLYRSSPTALPPAWTMGTYAAGVRTTGTDVREEVRIGLGSTGSGCSGSGGGGGGSVTIDSVTATNVSGTFTITGSSTYTGTFNVPICNAPSGATGCCVE